VARDLGRNPSELLLELIAIVTAFAQTSLKFDNLLFERRLFHGSLLE